MFTFHFEANAAVQRDVAAQRLITSAGDVVALGDGKVGVQTRDFSLKVGDTIIYNKFGLGATDLEVRGDTHILIKEDDCIGTLPRSGATAADIVDLKPLGDRVLLKVSSEAATAKKQPFAFKTWIVLALQRCSAHACMANSRLLLNCPRCPSLAVSTQNTESICKSSQISPVYCLTCLVPANFRGFRNQYS